MGFNEPLTQIKNRVQKLPKKSRGRIFCWADRLKNWNQITNIHKPRDMIEMSPKE